MSIINDITNRQMFFIIFMTLTTYSTIDLPKTMAQSAGRSGWIPVIIVSIIFGIAAVIIAKLNSMFLGKVFFDYSQEIVGKYITYLIAFYYTLYFIFIGLYLKQKLAGVLTSNFMSNTPKFVFIIFGIILSAFSASKGITNIARMLEIYGITFLLVTIATCFFMLVGGDKYNILPLYNTQYMKEFTKTMKDLIVLPFFNAAEIKGYAKAMKDLIVPYGGLEILFITAFTDNKKGPRTAFFTLLFIGLFYSLIVESTIMILGINNTILLNDSFIEAIKITDAPVIERLDILYLTFGLTSLFSGMIIVFSAVVEYACKLFSKVKRFIIIIIISVIFAILCFICLQIKDFDKVFERVAYYPVIISGFVIPVTIFIIAKAKKTGMKNPGRRS